MKGSKSPVTVMTGASSRLGQHVARALINEGHLLLTISRGHCSELSAQHAGSKHIQCDLSNRKSISELTNRVSKCLIKMQPSSIGILHIAGAQFLCNSRRWECELESMFHVHVTSLWNLVRCVESHWISGTPGCVVAVSSNLTKRPTARLVGYSTTKAAMEALCYGLALKLGRFDVTCNSISPGIIPSASMDQIPRKKLQDIREKTPLGRLASTKDVGDVILCLLLKRLWITGQNIVVDGGNYIGW
jgi:3-oxoacyl-[acyl-carrier protein] reductase